MSGLGGGAWVQAVSGLGLELSLGLGLWGEF